MNRLWMLWMRLMDDAVSGADAGGNMGAGAGNGGGTGATSAAGAAATGAGDSGAGAAGAATGGAAADGGGGAGSDDLMAQLEAIMAAQSGDGQAGAADAAAGDGAAAAGDAAGAVPEAFRAALEISPLVSTPESVQQAVRAADEVWRVAAGEIPARQMLEGFRASNPDGFAAVVDDLAAYIGEITGESPARSAQPSPLEALAASHPQIFAAMQEFVKKNTGVELGGAADPRDARLSAIEQQIAAEQEARGAAQWNERVNAARGKAIEFLSAKAKGTFAEGQEAYMLTLCGAKAGIPEAQMIDMILSGKTERLEAAYKAVVKDETARLKAYNANLIKQHRALKDGIPASGTGGGAKLAAVAGAPARKDGESDVAYATRLWQSGN